MIATAAGTPTQPKASQTPREAVETAVLVLEEHGKKLSPKDIWRILVALPISLYIVAVTAVTGIAGIAFKIGKWHESRRESATVTRERPTALVVDRVKTTAANRDSSPIVQAIWEELASTTTPPQHRLLVARIETEQLKSATPEFTALLSVATGNMVNSYCFRVTPDPPRAPALQPLERTIVDRKTIMTVPPASPGDTLLCVVSVLTPKTQVSEEPNFGELFRVEVQK